jgi:hypothetical protein
MGGTGEDETSLKGRFTVGLDDKIDVEPVEAARRTSSQPTGILATARSNGNMRKFAILFYFCSSHRGGDVLQSRSSRGATASAKHQESRKLRASSLFIVGSVVIVTGVVRSEPQF